MSETELELSELVKSDNFETAVSAAVQLYRVFLLPRKDFENAEFVLLETLGKQSIRDGFIIELCLGELYIEIDEWPRATRYLDTVSTSSHPENKAYAQALMQRIHEAKSEN